MNEVKIIELPQKQITPEDYALIVDDQGQHFKGLYSDIAEITSEALLESGEVAEILANAEQAVIDASQYGASGYTASPDSPSIEGVDIVNVSAAGTYTNFGNLIVSSEDLSAGLVQLRREESVWKKVIIPIGTGLDLIENNTQVRIPVTEAFTGENVNGGTTNLVLGNLQVPNGVSGDGTVLLKSFILNKNPDVKPGDVLVFTFTVKENIAGISNGPKLFHRLYALRNGSVVSGEVSELVQTRVDATTMRFGLTYTVNANDTVLYPYIAKGALVNSTGASWIWTVERINIVSNTLKFADNPVSENFYLQNKRLVDQNTTLTDHTSKIVVAEQFQKNHNKIIIGQPSLVQITYPTPTTVKVDITGVLLIFDERSGYRTIDPVSITLNNNEILCLSGSSGSYSSPNLNVKGAGSKLFLYKYAFNSLSSPLDGYCELGAVMGYQWVPVYISFQEKTSNTDLNNLITESNSRKYLNDRFVEFTQRGFLQSPSDMTSPIADKIPLFVDKWRRKGKDSSLAMRDLNIVMLDGSISTDMDYSVKRTDQAYRPPLCTEKNIPSFIEEKLRWAGQQYRRYDSMTLPAGTTPSFIEVGTGVTKRLDAVWDWVYSGTQPTQPDYNGLTRVLTGANPSVTYAFPARYRRCDFIYRTDSLSTDAMTVTVAGGNGNVEVYNESSNTWVEANGFVISARELNVLLPGTSPITSLVSTGLRKTIYQKRLKMRRAFITSDRNITIASTDGGRLCYWGIQFSKKEWMINFINSARGSHDINSLRYFEDWSVDYWKPDLILYSCNTINERSSVASLTSTLSPTAFATNFKNFINILLAKSYQPEMVAYINFCMRGQNLVSAQDEVQATNIAGWGSATLFDYHDELFADLQALPIGSMNAFYQYWEIAKRRSEAYGTSIYAEMHGATGVSSNSFTCDTTHLNEYGAMIGWRYFGKYFNF